MARYFNIPFANAGDKNDIPDPTQADGAVNYTEGYGPDYSLDPVANAATANRVERQIFNELLFQITDVLKEYYERTYPPYTSTITYAQYARVLFNNRIYESRINSNSTNPTNTTNWQLVDIAGLEALFYTRTAADAAFLNQSEGDARYLNEASNLSDLPSSTTARTNLGLGTSATRSTGTATGAIPRIGTPGTTSTNGNSAVVVRAGSNANGFYRVWSDGYIEQWGRATRESNSATSPLIGIFPIAFSIPPANRSTGTPISNPGLTIPLALSPRGADVSTTSVNFYSTYTSSSISAVYYTVGF